jgi:tetratricopeptide (TPR) repeat protein
MVLFDQLQVRLMAGDSGRGREAFEEALRLNPDVARAHSSLGFLLAEGGQAEEAIAHWKSAVALDPAECGKLLALAQLLAQRGRAAEARPYLELFAASAPPALYARDLARVRGGSPGSRIGRRCRGDGWAVSLPGSRACCCAAPAPLPPPKSPSIPRAPSNAPVSARRRRACWTASSRSRKANTAPPAEGWLLQGDRRRRKEARGRA